MKIFAGSIAALILAASSTRALEHNFDQGVDIGRVVREVQKNAASKTSKIKVQDARALFDREERDCSTISFRVDDPMRSERIRLESRIYREHCWQVPDYPRPPRNPRRYAGESKGSFNAQRRECREEWVRTERRNVRIEISGRGDMLPWERDIFRVCLQGQWLSAHVVDASHSYSLDVPGWNGDTVFARATGKTQSNPDASGIQERAFGFDAGTGNFVLEMGDRWNTYYTGETVAFTIKLRRHHKNWFDSTILEKEIVLPAAEAYRIDFAQYVEELSGDLKPGKHYYVKWRFRRIGSVSKNDWQPYRETGKSQYNGAEIQGLMISAR